MRIEIEDRIRALERRSRLLLLRLAQAGPALSAVAASGDGEAATLRARRLEIARPDGALVAVLGVADDGAAGLFVHDPGGGPP